MTTNSDFLVAVHPNTVVEVYKDRKAKRISKIRASNAEPGFYIAGAVAGWSQGSCYAITDMTQRFWDGHLYKVTTEDGDSATVIPSALLLGDKYEAEKNAKSVVYCYLDLLFDPSTKYSLKESSRRRYRLTFRGTSREHRGAAESCPEGARIIREPISKAQIEGLGIR